MNIKLTLGERLKDLRVERSLKLETLAEQTGRSHRHSRISTMPIWTDPSALPAFPASDSAPHAGL